jgi:hypothetical protein
MQLVSQDKNGKRIAMAAGTGLIVAGASTSAMAVDTTVVQADIDAAEADALTTGEMVIGAVAGLVVVGLIIGMVRKL